MSEHSQEFLWECMGALSGYGSQPWRCPICDEPVESIVQEQPSAPSIEVSFGRGPVDQISMGPPRIWMEPCRHTLTREDADVLAQRWSSYAIRQGRSRGR